METRYVWVTTRRLKESGTLHDFERAWRPQRHPEGMERAFAYWSADGLEVMGVSFWDSKEFCDRWLGSEDERRRREAMAPFVAEESEAFYEGRELRIPGE
jgi:heme-degrading monooxygenase HmoA